MTDKVRSPTAATARTAPDPRRWKALVLLSIASFIVILDSQIVILALPSIERDLRLSTGAGQWVLSAYMLAFGGLLLFGGRLADLWGRRRMFLVGTALFGASSVLCGAAWTGWALIGARVVQGASASIMAPAGLAILMTMFPEGSERNRALAYWSGVGGLGATAALLIGGALTGGPGWEWIFYLNVPVTGVLLVFGPGLLRESRERLRAYDPAGAVTITLGLILLIGAIVRAPEGGWASLPVVGMLVGSAVMIGLFVLVESRSAAPLVPLRIFRSRAFSGGNLTVACFGMTAWGMGTTISAYAQEVLGYSPLRFGLGQAAMTVMTMVGAYAAQAVLGRVGARTVAAVCLVLTGAGAFLLSQAPADGGYVANLLPALLIFGLGLGGGSVAATSAALSSVADQDAGVASGTNTAAFQIGGALGTAIIASVIVSSAGGSTPQGLTRGFQAGFAADVVFAALGLCVCLAFLRRR